MPSIVQRSFNAGEIAPGLYGRADQIRYQSGLRTMLNFIPLGAGPATNRPGTYFACQGRSAVYARMVPFIYSTDQTYVLEFGAGYIRFIQNGTQVETAAAAYNAGTTYEIGELVTYGGSTYYSLQDGNVGNTPDVTPAYWDAQTGTIFEVPHSIGTTSILKAMHIVQNADVLIITHPSFAPKKLSRLGHTWWTLTDIPFNPELTGPTDVSVVKGGTAGSKTLRYKVTAYDSETGEESIPASQTTNQRTVSMVDGATPVEVTTSTAHAFNTGDEVYVEELTSSSTTYLAAGWYTITKTGGSTFTIDGSTGITGGAVAVDGTPICYRLAASIVNAKDGTSANPHVISWSAITGADEYNIYRAENGIYGLIGVADGLSFEDVGYSADLTDTPPTGENPFDSTDNYPSFAAFFQQRLCFAKTNNKPRSVWMSKPGLFYNFTKSSPIKDDDRIFFTLAGNQMDGIQSMTEVGGRLIILTGSGEYTLDGDSDGVVRPTAINLKQQGYSGSSSLRPVVSGNNALYVTARGAEVRDFRYSLAENAYEGRDLSIFSAHLLRGRSIDEWAHAQAPFHCTWMKLDNNTLIGLVYLREHEVVGWFRADVSGDVQSLCVVPEGTEDVLYLYVIREVNGSNMAHIERLHTRNFTLLEDGFFVDAGLSYDGRNTSTTTMTLSAAGWTTDDEITITASASYFSASNVDDEIVLTTLDDNGLILASVRVVIHTYTSTTVVKGYAFEEVPAAFQATATTSWRLAQASFAGLEHLEGETVAVCADGNAATATVASGAITLDTPAAVVHAGLPIIADAEPLDVETVEQETRIGKQIIVKDISLYLENTRGLTVGRDVNNLEDFKERDAEEWADNVRMITGKISKRIDGKYTNHGRVLIRQGQPFPATILALVRSGEVGDR